MDISMNAGNAIADAVEGDKVRLAFADNDSTVYVIVDATIAATFLEDLGRATKRALGGRTLPFDPRRRRVVGDPNFGRWE